jgi:hypothetical protein
MAITLDITGFYFSSTIDFTEDLKTVEDVMERMRGRRSKTGGVLDFKLDEGKFIEFISVEYDGRDNPTTRQINSAIKTKIRPRGVYKYIDNVFEADNRIQAGGIPGLLVWQYYVTSQEGVLKSGATKDGTRVVLPLSTSNIGVTLADNDRITWRLVGIFGLNKILDDNRPVLAANSNGTTLSLKRAFEILGKEQIDLSVSVDR